MRSFRRSALFLQFICLNWQLKWLKKSISVSANSCRSLIILSVFFENNTTVNVVCELQNFLPCRCYSLQSILKCFKFLRMFNFFSSGNVLHRRLSI